MSLDTDLLIALVILGVIEVSLIYMIWRQGRK